MRSRFPRRLMNLEGHPVDVVKVLPGRRVPHRAERKQPGLDLNDQVGKVGVSHAPLSHGICRCSLHRLPRHPSTYREHAGLLGLYDLCWCECDHAPDEERWAA